MYDYTPNLRICRKVVSLWVGMMHRPKFDQLGQSRSEQSPDVRVREDMGQFFTDQITKDTTQEQLDKFAVELERILITEYPFRDLPDERFADHRGPFKEDTVDWLKRDQWVMQLGTDYHPDFQLRMAGLYADLPDPQFPIKTRMFIDKTYISLRAGYGARSVYYYPMEDGNWLVTSLSGNLDEIEKIKGLALEVPGSFQIEKDKVSVEPSV